MNGRDRGRCRRLIGLLVPLAFAAAAIPAAPSGAAEPPKLSPAEVAERLETIRVIARDVAVAGSHQEKAALLAEGIPPVWARIENTVKANDKASYEALEAAIGSLTEAAEAGDGTRSEGAAGALTSAVNFYVAKFPAAGGSDRKAASAGPQPASAASEPKGADETPVPAERRAAADGSDDAPAAAPAGAALARTGSMPGALAALAGGAFALGGLGVMAGARRRTPRIS